MRNLFLFMMTSLDGYFEGPNHDITWHMVDDEFNEFAIKQLNEVDMLIFGRVTYELMAGYWPSEQAIKDDPIVADLMNSTPKIVVSKTLDKAEWENTRLINDNVEEEIHKLKEQPGKGIAIFGSNNLCVSLMEKGLLDEVRVIVNPVVIGGGTPLFAGIDHELKLKLVDTKPFQSGNVLLNYQPTA